MTQTDLLVDLQYELRMLLGATGMCRLFDEQDLGNPVNYFKDAVYLHARNLYNFFGTSTRNDAHVKNFTQHAFDLSLYTAWSAALHNHVMHIKPGRINPNNVINGIHINEMIYEFTKDIESLWQDWVNHSGSVSKSKLERILAIARKGAQEDYRITKERLK